MKHIKRTYVSYTEATAQLHKLQNAYHVNTVLICINAINLSINGEYTLTEFAYGQWKRFSSV